MRLTAEHRRNQIVETARNLSYEGGLYDWKLDDIAEHIGITRNAVKYYFYSATNLRELTIRNAIDDGDIPIVVQALARYDPIVSDISDTLRNACGRYVSDGTPAA